MPSLHPIESKFCSSSQLFAESKFGFVPDVVSVGDVVGGFVAEFFGTDVE